MKFPVTFTDANCAIVITNGCATSSLVIISNPAWIVASLIALLAICDKCPRVKIYCPLFCDSPTEFKIFACFNIFFIYFDLSLQISKTINQR